MISKKCGCQKVFRTSFFFCDLTSYGQNIVASVSEELRSIAEEYVGRFPVEHCFETPNLHWLMDRIRPLGYDVCFMAEYSLPDITLLVERECPYEIKMMEQKDFQGLYVMQRSNAPCEKRKEFDVMGAGTFNCDGRLVGLAGASADCEAMRQIEIDMLPEYCRKEIASIRKIRKKQVAEEQVVVSDSNTSVNSSNTMDTVLLLFYLVLLLFVR